MSRIFLVLALFAISLLVANLAVALALGDFGSKSAQYAAARREVATTGAAPATSSTQLDEQLARLEQLGVELAQQRNRFWPHIWLGIAASLISLLVNSISITYFIGTTRWCREVAEAYGMSDDLPVRANTYKRKSFAWAFAGILLTIAIAGTGGAADPFSSSSEPAGWVMWHWLLGMGGVVLIAASFFAQFNAVTANHEVIEEVLVEAERIRQVRAESEP